MELRRNSYILPSNAPPLSSTVLHDIAIAHGVLQERCGNRQHDLLDADLSNHRKYNPLSPIENSYGYGYGGSLYTRPQVSHAPMSEEDLHRHATYLWRRLQHCDQYRKYRGRQPKDCGQQEQKWPEHMEAAFCKALVKYPPMGRRKQTSGRDTKPRGRNELIADAIQRWTGEARTRKQVSSHIQVLKPMVKDDPYIMHYLSKEDLNPRSRHSRASASMYRRYATQETPHYPQYPTLPPAVPAHLPTGPLSPLPLGSPLGDRLVDLLPNTVEPIEFDMFVRDPRQDSRVRLHTFTKFGKSPKLPDLQLDDNDEWQRSIPQLTSMYSQRALDCQIIFAEASMELMTETVPKGAELGIHFELSSACDLTPNKSSQCRTRFFNNGVLVEQSAGRVTYDENYPNHITVPFGSEFWAQKITHLANLLREAAKRRTLLSDEEDQAAVSEEAIQRLEDRARDELKSLSAVQEIVAMRKGGFEPQKMLIIYWTFSQAVHAGTGETTWRNVILPVPGIKEEAAAGAAFESITDGLASNPLPDMSQSFEQHNFDLEDLSSIALAGMPTDVGASAPTAEMYPTDDVDFTGGHIHISLENPLPLEDYQDASTTQFVEDLQNEVRQWSSTYPSYLDPSAYSNSAYVNVVAQIKDEPTVPSADYLASPLAGMRGEHGVLSGL